MMTSGENRYLEEVLRVKDKHKNNKIIDAKQTILNNRIKNELEGLSFTKNFRSATAEEWYVFLPSFEDPQTGGAAGKAIIHYDLYGNRDIFINSTVIFDDPKLHEEDTRPIVHAIVEELINRLVGYADTLLSVHSGENSYHAVYKSED